MALAALLAAGCFQSSAPAGWLPNPDDSQRQAFGSWIRVQDVPGPTAKVVEGELIAVDADTIHVFSGERLVALPRAVQCCVTLTAFAMDYSPIVMWGALGTLSTISHGVGLIFTAPVWALAGTSAASSASIAPRVKSTDPDALRPFARFPQGIPPGLDRSKLRAKPWTLPANARRP